MGLIWVSGLAGVRKPDGGAPGDRRVPLSYHASCYQARAPRVSRATLCVVWVKYIGLVFLCAVFERLRGLKPKGKLGQIQTVVPHGGRHVTWAL